MTTPDPIPELAPGAGPVPYAEPRSVDAVSLDDAIARAQRHLAGIQKKDGHWCAELQGDNILESEYVMLLWVLGRGDEVRVRRACEHLRASQLDEGGWALFPGGDPDPNPSVKSYFALKLAGDDSDAPHMQKAREAILRVGGIEATNSFTRLFLCVFGQYDWKLAPAVPPELMRLPLWAPINIWEMSSWSRAIVVPLSIVWATKPSVQVPEGRGIEELRTYRKTPMPAHIVSEGLIGVAWANAFRALDLLVKLAEAAGAFKPLRRGSIERGKKWIEARLVKSDGLGAIFPSILNVILAYKALGYPDEHPVVASQLRELEKLEVSDGDALKVQPCCSPVWDTSLTMNAMLESGVAANDSALQRAGSWLLAKEVKEAGDWQVKNTKGPIGGWFFEYNNEFYPDCDDTAEILAVFSKLRFDDPIEEAERRAATERAIAWQLSMQNDDGGWGAFDRECNKKLLTYIPFADHNAMIDPSTADVTARTIEALRAQSRPADAPEIVRGLEFLRRVQEPDGSWYGRWGANYLYGTWLAICAFASVGESAFGETASETCRRGVGWLLSVQNEDGGWGESLRSYHDAAWKGRGESTAAQTAWSVMALLAGYGALDDAETRQAIDRGVSFLLDRQKPDGSWSDEAWTGTGFPAVFYLRYYGYALYFPLQALATYRERALEKTRS